MKKYWSLLMALVLVLSICCALVGCVMDDTTVTTIPDETLKSMIESIEEVNGTKQVAVETKASFYVLGMVRNGKTTAKVLWTVEGSEKVTLGAMDEETKQIKVNIPHTDVAFSYTLVATIVNENNEPYKNAEGNAYSAKFVHTVPVTSAATEIKDLYNESIIATVEAGKPYKMAMYCVADAKVYYFAGKNAVGSDGKEKKYKLATTIDANQAGDMYLEAVEGGYLLYFLDGTTKKYVESCEYVSTYKDASIDTVEKPTEGFKWTFDAEKQILVGPTTEETGEAFLAGYTNSDGVITTEIVGRKIEYFTKSEKNYALHFVNKVEYTYQEFVKPTTTKGIIDAVLALDEYQQLPEGPYTLKGTVSKITYAYSNGSMSFEMTLDDLPEQTVIVYKLATSEDPAIEVGTKVTVTGELLNYGGKPEFTNAKAVKEGGVTPDPDPQPTGKEDFLASIAKSVEMDKEYYLALWQGNNGKALYFKGEMNGYYLATVEDMATSVAVKFVAAEGDSFYISFVDSTGATKYLSAAVNDTYNNILISDTKGATFTWNADIKGFTTVLGENTFYVGTFGKNSTFSLSNLTYITGDKASTLDESNFVVHAIAKDGGSVTPDPDPQPETDEEKVAKAKTALEASSLTLTEANKELALPTYTSATLTWKLTESEATLKLSEDGLKISATALPTDADKTIQITVEITIGTAKATATVEVIVKKEVETLTIAEFLEKADETNAYNVGGVVTAFDRKAIFIQDETGASLYVYDNGKTRENVEIGKSVVFTGKFSEYNGLKQMSPTALVKVENTEVKISATVLDEAAIKTLTNASAAKLVTVNNVEFVSVSGSVDNGITYKFKLGETTISVRAESGGKVEEINAALKDAKAGDMYHLVNVNIGWYNGLQFLLSNPESIVVKQYTDAEKVAAEKAALTAPLTEVTEAKDYPIATVKGATYADVTIAWTLKTAFDGITVEANTLKVAALPETASTITLVATLTLGEATETKEFEVAVAAAPKQDATAEEKIAFEKEALAAPLTEISEAKDYAIETLSGKTYKDVTITWALKEAFEGVTVEANVIKVAKLPAAKGSITLVATLAVGETTDTVEFFVTVNAEVVKPASIEFTFEGSGKSGHQDGSPASGTLTYTSGDYTLKISSMTKVYNKANDAKGNGALKLGTQSAAAEFTITVPEGFKTVKIYIAGYKANACKFKINGGEVQTTTKASDDGEYDCIEITVPEDGTITLETVSGGYRGMISKIEFVA